MAAINAAALAASARSAPPPDEAPLRPRVSALLLLCRFGTVAALLLAVVSFPQSSFFTIRDIRVDGARAVTGAELIALAGVRTGDPASAVSVADIRRRIAALPLIQSVDVQIGPTGRLLIEVTERSATAAMPFRGRFIVLDRGGVAIAERAEPGSLPVIIAGSLPWLRLGDIVPSAAIPDSIRALGELPPGLPRAGLVVERSPTGELSVLTPDRITVRLGTPRGLRERAAALPEILTALRSRRMAVEYLDLRFTGNVIVKPTGTLPGAGVKP